MGDGDGRIALEHVGDWGGDRNCVGGAGEAAEAVEGGVRCRVEELEIREHDDGGGVVRVSGGEVVCVVEAAACVVRRAGDAGSGAACGRGG